MFRSRWVFAVAAVCLLVPAGLRADDAGEKVDNPFYSFWTNCKVGSTATHVERVKVSGPEGKLMPGAQDVKRIRYKLVELTPERAVVEQVVREKEILGEIEQAPTRMIYPAKVAKEELKNVLDETGARIGEETVKYQGNDVKVATVQGKYNRDGADVEFKRWYLKDIPGAIVKQVRRISQEGKVLQESTIDLVDYKKAD